MDNPPDKRTETPAKLTNDFLDTKLALKQKVRRACQTCKSTRHQCIETYPKSPQGCCDECPVGRVLSKQVRMTERLETNVNTAMYMCVEAEGLDREPGQYMYVLALKPCPLRHEPASPEGHGSLLRDDKRLHVFFRTSREPTRFSSTPSLCAASAGTWESTACSTWWRWSLPTRWAVGWKPLSQPGLIFVAKAPSGALHRLFRVPTCTPNHAGCPRGRKEATFCFRAPCGSRRWRLSRSRCVRVLCHQMSLFIV